MRVRAFCKISVLIVVFSLRWFNRLALTRIMITTIYYIYFRSLVEIIIVFCLRRLKRQRQLLLFLLKKIIFLFIVVVSWVVSQKTLKIVFLLTHISTFTFLHILLWTTEHFYYSVCKLLTCLTWNINFAGNNDFFAYFCKLTY